MSVKTIEDAYPLSSLQQGILFHSLYAPSSGVYVEQMSFDLSGRLNVSAFTQAWQQVIDRHSILRTAFVWEKVKKPLQVVGRHVKLPWEEHNWQGISPIEQQERLKNLLQAERRQGFELSKAPLMRLTLIQLTEATYHLIWSHHHLLLDGWSTQLIFKEVIAYYEAFCQDQQLSLERPRPYRDYIAWLQQQDLSQAEAFWREKFKGFTAPTPLSVDQVFRKLPDQKEDYEEQEIRLSTRTTAALQSLGQQQHLTLNTLVQGAWALLLSRYSGEEDVVFGATVSGRSSALAKVESMVGLFINTLPIRVQVASEESLVTWLQQLQAQQTEARQYEYSPLVDIQGWSNVPRDMPLFDSIVVFENYPVEAHHRERVAELEIGNVRAFEKTNYPLTFVALPGSELVLKILYDCRRFDSATITRMLGHFQTVLESMVANPKQRLCELSLLTEGERQQLLEEWNDTEAEYPQDRCLHQLFEEQVERSPDAIAVVFEDQQLTYRELDQRADQLAHHLQMLGVKPEVLVGICVERSLEMLIGLLGILKAGGAYVPLDPAYPKERLAFMLEDAQVSVLLTQQRLLEILPEHRAEIICLDADGEAIKADDCSLIENSPPQPPLARGEYKKQRLSLGDTGGSTGGVKSLNSSNLAYVIYTSGSTGKPKGVQISHRALVNFLCSMRLKPGLTKQDRLLCVTTLSFDIAGLELYLPLIVGARVVIASREVAADGRRLSELLTHSGATVMQATPATWRLLLAAGWQGDKTLKILCGGEALSRELANQLLTRCDSLWNLYGPTETTIWSTLYQVKSGDGLVPIGRAIANTQAYILDHCLQPTPIGVPGELYIGGAGVARGYLNRPELTAERFISNPFQRGGGAGEQGSRGEYLYKTGDLARHLPNGDIDYLGRIDHQVKIRGFRIELGEIETALAQYPGVEQAVVLAREDSPGLQRLVAYIVLHEQSPNPKSHPPIPPLLRGEQNPKSNELREFLKKQLPDYMIPAAFVLLSALPLTPNGKVDRRALPAPDTRMLAGETDFVAPRTPVEEVLTNLWAEVLNLERVGIDDNFFELGGHSLLATQLISRIRDTFQVELPLRCLFESPTIAELSQGIEATRPTQLEQQIPPLVPVSRSGELPLSFAQARLWFLDRIAPGNSAYNISAAVRLTGVLNVPALQQSFNEIVRRHEALRTTFAMGNEQPIQVIAPSMTLPLPIVDWRELPEAEQQVEIQRLAVEEAQRPFDLEQDLLLRATLLQLGETEHILLLTMHHIVSDGWSMGVLVREVAALYKAFTRGEPSPLPELPIQYADFAVWQQEWLLREALDAQLSYWKQQLGGAPSRLKLPTDRSRPEVQTFRGATSRFVLPKDLSDAICASQQRFAIATLSRQEGVTLFMLLLAAFQTLLSRYSNQDDIVVGTDVANRNRSELEPLIGFFVNLLVLRTDLSGNPSFRELLRRVREVTLGAYAHQDVPFAKLVEALGAERNLNHTPLFQVLFVLQNAPMPSLELSGLTLTPIEVETGTAKFDLALFMEQTEQGIVGTWNYSTDLFDDSTITRMSGHFEMLLSSIVAQPDTPIKTLEMLSETEKQQQLLAQEQRKKTKFNKFKSVKPKAVSLPQGDLIKTDYLTPGETLPLVVQPTDGEIDFVDWAKSDREFIETQLLKHGAILFRGFSVNSASEFETVAQAICPELFGEYGDLPREGVGGKVYASTPYPADKAILFHNESSHLQRFPLKIWFFCVQPAQQGGETPIVDCRKMYQLLDPKLREKLANKQLMYVRNYIEGLDVSWQDFFRTTDKAVVEEYCDKAGIDFEWLPGKGLRTRQVRPAIAKHPKTGELVFFNQIQLHHLSFLDSAVRDSLLSLFGEEKLPRNVYYGDGSPLEESVIQEINEIYQQSQISFPWQKGDILMLDNLLAAHSRNPYVGSRKIVVAMGEMINL
ncbi:MAG: amino acid adenylation domain-containing protein [Kastovskya adunca ATA6-11-RM4]|jgi:amino acid adenylation domain-containing protein|nr:amino acid adenylation domain-containing protein [Kastovskya adunca ATA6-11-RM4]